MYTIVKRVATMLGTSVLVLVAGLAVLKTAGLIEWLPKPPPPTEIVFGAADTMLFQPKYIYQLWRDGSLVLADTTVFDTTWAFHYPTAAHVTTTGDSTRDTLYGEVYLPPRLVEVRVRRWTYSPDSARVSP